jgi:multiple sugar transport system permease protein
VSTTVHTADADPGPAAAGPGVDARAKRSHRTLTRRRTIAGIGFILPNFAGFVVLTLGPVVALFYIAFTKWTAFGSPTFTGLDNFRRLVADKTFWAAFGHTLYYSGIHIPVTLVLSLSLAILLNQKLRGRAFFRAAAFFPYFTSIVAVAQVWNMLFSPEHGPINQFLRFVGIDNPPDWVASSAWAMPAVIIVGVWRETGYYMLLFLAGLQGIPPELHEAAKMDGAGFFQRLWNVTWPSLRPTTFFVTVMLTIGSFKVLDLILVMTNGGPGTSTLVLSQYIYRMGFERNDFSYASAVSLVLFALCMVVTIIQFAYNRHQEK